MSGRGTAPALAAVHRRRAARARGRPAPADARGHADGQRSHGGFRVRSAAVASVRGVRTVECRFPVSSRVAVRSQEEIGNASLPSSDCRRVVLWRWPLRARAGRWLRADAASPPQQPPAGQPPAGAAACGSPAGQPRRRRSCGSRRRPGVLLVQIKPDQTADFEEMMGKLKDGAGEERRTRCASSRRPAGRSTRRPSRRAPTRSTSCVDRSGGAGRRVRPARHALQDDDLGPKRARLRTRRCSRGTPAAFAGRQPAEPDADRRAKLPAVAAVERRIGAQSTGCSRPVRSLARLSACRALQARSDLRTSG